MRHLRHHKEYTPMLVTPILFLYKFGYTSLVYIIIWRKDFLFNFYVALLNETLLVVGNFV